MTTSSQDRSHVPAGLQPEVGDFAGTGSRRAVNESRIYRPTSLLRNILNRSARGQAAGEVLAEKLPHAAAVARAPGVLSFLGVAIVLGVASGFLELAALQIQARVGERIGWHSLMVSRHVSWMVPLTAPLVIAPLAVSLVWPALALSAWRQRRGRSLPSSGLVRTWGWAGTVLGTLFILGPILATRSLHLLAAAALALGLGFRLSRALVSPTSGWRRFLYLGAGIIIVALPTSLFIQWNAIVSRPKLVSTQSAASSPNLIWIVLDTLSATHMSLYGYDRPTTPELEAWAKKGVTFEMARSAAPWTLPSHVTMFTGLWPFEHDARVDRAYRGSSPTLAEHLSAQGYQTAGIVANVRMCNLAYGVGRGFDDYVDEPGNVEISLRSMMYNSALGSLLMRVFQKIGLPVPGPAPFGLERPAREITADAWAWLNRAAPNGPGETSGPHRPFFLFLNLMDTHGPYMPSSEAAGRFWTGPKASKTLATPATGWKAQKACDNAPPEQRDECDRRLLEVRRMLAGLYDECIYGVDAELGRFLGRLRAEGRLEKTWVVITADHGEHFGEHHLFGHGASLYNEQTHVPLILIPPLAADEASPDGAASLRGRRVSVPVAQRNLPVTLTELLIPGAPNPFPGRSLAPCWSDNGPMMVDPVLSQMEQPGLAGEDFAPNQGDKINSLIAENHVLIDRGSNRPELYAIEDRQQQHNLADQPAQQPRINRLRSTLATLRSAPVRR